MTRPAAIRRLERAGLTGASVTVARGWDYGGLTAHRVHRVSVSAPGYPSWEFAGASHPDRSVALKLAVADALGRVEVAA